MVDDSDSSISYSPTWAIGNTCSSCTAKPVSGQTYQQTWHDNTRNPGATDSVYLQYTFTGTGITLYGIFCNEADKQNVFITRYDLAFTLDGASAGGFVHEPSGDNSYQYGQTVFNKQGLSNGQHTIRVDLNQNSMMLFDYLVVTTADSETSANPGGGGNGNGSSSVPSSSNSPNSPSSGPTSPSSTSSAGIASTVTVNGTAVVVTTGTFGTLGAPSGSMSSDVTNTLLPISGGTVLNQNNNNISLSKAAIVGIAFAIIALSLIFGFLFFFFWRKRTRKQMQMRIDEVDAFVTPTATVSRSPYSVPSVTAMPMDRKSPMNSTHNVAVDETPRMTMMSSDAISHTYSGTGTGTGAETETGTGTETRSVRGAYSGMVSPTERSRDDTGTAISSEDQSRVEDRSEAGRERYRSMASVSDLQMAPPPYQQ